MTWVQRGQRAFLDSAVAFDSLTGAAAENANYTLNLSGGDAYLIMRSELENDSGSSALGGDQGYQFRINGGTWNDLTTSSTGAKAASGHACTSSDNDGVTTNLLTTATGGFNYGFFDNNGGAPATWHDPGAHSELATAVLFVAADLSHGDTVEFRLKDATIWDNIVVVTVNKGTTASYSITGSVTVSATPAAAMKEGRAITGALAVSATPAAAMAVGRQLDGALAVSATPAAAMKEGRAIAGAQQVALTPAAVMAEGRVIAGALPVTVTPGAGMAFGGGGSIAGDVAIAATPAAAMKEGRAIAGDVPILAQIAAGLASGHAIDGALSIDIVPAAVMKGGAPPALALIALSAGPATGIAAAADQVTGIATAAGAATAIPIAAAATTVPVLTAEAVTTIATEVEPLP